MPLAHSTRNDLPRKVREKIVDLLSDRLSDTIDLRSQIHQAHWNVKGPNFIGLHELFDKIVGELGEPIDDIAERIVQLGGSALGTVRIAAKRSTLREYPANISAGKDHVDAVSDVLAVYGKLVREAIERSDEIGDKDTADLFTGISRQIDKALWLVEAHGQARA